MKPLEPPYEIAEFGDIRVFFVPELDGGGSGYGQDYISFLQQNFGPQHRVFEWCAGPGFIGFSILAHGLCDSLCLADVNPAAVEACRITVRENGLEDRVTIYESEGLLQIPESEQWDLVVGNPPHSGSDQKIESILKPVIVYQDIDWKIHRQFYLNIANHLGPGGQIVIQENAMFSDSDTFRGMIEENGLEIVATPKCLSTWRDCYYYVWSRPVSHLPQFDRIV